MNILHQTPETALAIAVLEGSRTLKVSGDCMEAVDIYDGDYITADLTKRPQGKGDIVVAWDVEGQRPAVKEYMGFGLGAHMVGTRYKNTGFQSDGSYRTDHAFPTSHILGVVSACCAPDGVLRWERDLSGHPEEMTITDRIGGLGACEAVRLVPYE